MARFTQGRVGEFQRRGHRLKRAYEDLCLLGAVLSETLGSVQEEDVHQSICPACPYPEAGAGPAKEASKGQQSKRKQGPKSTEEG